MEGTRGRCRPGRSRAGRRVGAGCEDRLGPEPPGPIEGAKGLHFRVRQWPRDRQQAEVAPQRAQHGGVRVPVPRHVTVLAVRAPTSRSALPGRIPVPPGVALRWQLGMERYARMCAQAVARTMWDVDAILGHVGRDLAARVIADGASLDPGMGMTPRPTSLCGAGPSGIARDARCKTRSARRTSCGRCP